MRHTDPWPSFIHGKISSYVNHLRVMDLVFHPGHLNCSQAFELLTTAKITPVHVDFPCFELFLRSDGCEKGQRVKTLGSVGQAVCLPFLPLLLLPLFENSLKPYWPSLLCWPYKNRPQVGSDPGANLPTSAFDSQNPQVKGSWLLFTHSNKLLFSSLRESPVSSNIEYYFWCSFFC